MEIYFTTKEDLSEIIRSGYAGIVKHTESNFTLDIIPREKRGEVKIDWEGWKHTKRFQPFTEEQNQEIERKHIAKVNCSAKKLWR